MSSIILLVVKLSFELRTFSVWRNCSTVELHHDIMERGRGIEPLALAWKAKVLPLYEPRILYYNINSIYVKLFIKNKRT